MYKLSVPILIQSLTDDNLSTYLDLLKQCKAQRVFIGNSDAIFQPDSIIYTRAAMLEKSIRFFQANGMETGVWASTLGHGGALSHDQEEYSTSDYTYIEGIYGGGNRYGYCPMDPDFTESFRKGIKAIAQMHPDLIMLDDDFRLNNRSYYMGCFCKLHLQEYYKMIGEVIPPEQLEEKIFTGGKNKYRTAYMELAAKTLLDFAKEMRRAVDEVDPSIRLGACTVYENWDYCGTDAMEIAKAFAGNTKPFIRTIGAPYHAELSLDVKLSDVIENTRLQVYWIKQQDIEAFTEGDVYPRPRYNISSAGLELFDLAMLADGSTDGILKYMIDYTQKPHYEMGYIKRHAKNESLRAEIREIFAGKCPTGVKPVNILHKIENWELPDTPPANIATRLIMAMQSTACRYLTLNSIPTTYTGTGQPLLILGENARYVEETELHNGAILDIPAAEILQSRGIDVGLMFAEDGNFAAEYYIADQDTIHGIGNCALKNIRCKESAQVLSTFLPGEAPASYLYENAQEQRFFVLAQDAFYSEANTNYYNNYYRQAQMVEAVEYVGNKKLPAVCLKNPKLYMLTSSDGNAASVLMLNIYQDEVLDPVVQLDKHYSQIRFVNCSGHLEGDKVYLSDIPAFGVAAFEVK